MAAADDKVLISRRSVQRTLPRGPVAILVAVAGVVGALTLIAVTALVPVDRAIALPFSIGPLDPVVGGVAAWILIGLAMSSTGGRGSHEDGKAVFLVVGAPIVASMALGGPAAAAWVALVGTLEPRDLRGEVPWYGVIWNQVGDMVPAVLGGFVIVSLRAASGGGLDRFGDFLIVMAGGAVWALMNTALTALMLRARTSRPARETFAVGAVTLLAHRTTESMLGWVFAATYASIAWWSPILLVVVGSVAGGNLDRSHASWLLRRHQLTQLPNHLALTEHAAEVRRSNGPGVCVFYIDLDGFKAVNDTYDHDVGDDVLREVGQRLRSCRRQDDFVAHLHGDEFVLVASGVTSDSAAQAIRERIQRNVAAPFEHPAGLIAVTASVGYQLVADLDSIADALRGADRAMMASKRAAAKDRIQRSA